MTAATPRTLPAFVPRRRSTVAILIALLLLVAICTAAYTGYTQLLYLRSNAILSSQNQLLSQTSADINRELGFIRHITRLLSNNGPLRQALDAQAPLNRDAVARTFSEFAASVPLISQLRWIDEQGQEQVRVNSRQGETRQVVARELQNKAGRYYFTEGMRQPESAIFITPLDLNIEHGVIEYPLQPTLRATLRTGAEEGLRAGLLVVNLDLSPLFSQIRAAQRPEAYIELVNRDGFWVIHGDPDLEWGHLLGQPENNLSKQEPELWRQAGSAPDSRGRTIGSRLYSWTDIALSSDQPGDRGSQLLLLASSDPALVARMRNGLLLPITGAALLGLLAGLWLIYRFYKSDLKLQQLYRRLDSEHSQLVSAHENLNRSHQQQALMQEELVETRKLSSLGMMVAGVAHELNTPTGGALMVVSSLQTLFDTDSEAADTVRLAKGLELIKLNLQQINNRITSFKRLAMDRAQDDIRPFSLDTVIGDLTLSLQPRIKQRPIALTVDLQPGIRMTGLPGILSQTLQNLIENALSHAFAAGESGEIRLKAYRAPSGDHLLIEVSDNGCGIDPTIRGNMFDPFVTSGRGQGHTGLGLHLVHLWVHRLLHGMIKVQSEPGKGTCFTLEIPLDMG